MVVMVMFALQGVDLRQYSREIESELRKVEVRSIQDCKSRGDHVTDHVTDFPVQTLLRAGR